MSDEVYQTWYGRQVPLARNPVTQRILFNKFTAFRPVSVPIYVENSCCFGLLHDVQ